MIKLSPNHNTNWKNDHLQFARLLSELSSSCHLKITGDLLASMDLELKDIHNILERAQYAWDLAVANTGHWFQEGDWVFWNDPDDGACSSFGIARELRTTHVNLWRFTGIPYPTPYIECGWQFTDAEIPYRELVPAITKMTVGQVGRYRISEQAVLEMRTPRVHVQLRNISEYTKP